MDNKEIIITEQDYMRITNLLKNINDDRLSTLEFELDRAHIVSDREIPNDIVTMNTTCTYLDLSNNKKSTITIVYPMNASLEHGKISIFAPLGSALIGLRINQVIDWTFPSGQKKQLKIINIIYQPEASGDWHL